MYRGTAYQKLSVEKLIYIAYGGSGINHSGSVIYKTSIEVVVNGLGSGGRIEGFVILHQKPYRKCRQAVIVSGDLGIVKIVGSS